MNQAIMRGDIFSADLSPVIGCEQGGIRPVVVIQNDTGNRRSPTVIVAAITTAKDKSLPTHVSLAGDQNLLYETSVVLLEQIRTIDKQRLAHYFGRLSHHNIEKTNKALSVSVGLREKAQVKKPKKSTLLTLCPDCLQTYKNVYGRVQRADRSQVYKDTCTICQTKRGFDYEVFS